MITVSAPGKIHLLGEHAVVYGKPAILTTVDLRVIVTIKPPLVIPSGTKNLKTKKQKSRDSSLIIQNDKIRRVLEPIIKNYLKIQTIPPHQVSISSQLPVSSGLGSSAAISAAYIGALLSFLKVKWDKKLVNDLTFEAETIFHGNPSGGDNSTVVFGGLILFQRKSPTEKIIQPLSFSIPDKLAKNFVIINTGKPKESTREMVEEVQSKVKIQKSKMMKIFENQEKLVKELLKTIKDSNESRLIEIIRAGEKNLEKIGVVSKYAASIIRKIEQAGGAAKICGGGGRTKGTGVLLCYYTDPDVIKNIAKLHKLEYIKTKLGVEGLKQE